MVKTLELDRTKTWICEGSPEISSQCYFSVEFWRMHNKITGNARGRGITWFIQLESNQAALRHYYRGGLIGKLFSDCYLFSSWESTRPYRELTLLHYLKQKGVRVPTPIAAQARREHCFYRADILTEKVPDAQNLISFLRKGTLGGHNVCRKVGKEIRKMHDAQVNHADLNLNNILVDDQDQIWIIDFDGCSVSVGEEFKTANLARLQRSFKKGKEKQKIHWESDYFNLISKSYRED